MEGLSLAQARHFYNLGYLKQFSIERDPHSRGWYIALLSNQSYRFVLVDSNTRRPRIHRRLDSALAAVETMGFQVKQLNLSQ